jgi:two-component system, LytTR family, response regulator
MKAIIVDDEPPARAEMRRLLAAFDDVEVVGEAASVDAARALLLRVRPDVLFVDINLNGASGFDLLDDVDPDVAVIFATAFDEFAVKAFEAAALDYLLKPIEPERLAACIARVAAWHDQQQESSVPSSSFRGQSWIFLEGARPEFIEIPSIVCIRAAHGAVEVITSDGKTRVATSTLAEWQQKLPPGDFVLMHRSTIVNLRHVARVEPWSNYSYRVFVKGMPDPIVMSRRQAAKLKAHLG